MQGLLLFSAQAQQRIKSIKYTDKSPNSFGPPLYGKPGAGERGISRRNRKIPNRKVDS